ncbi:hypothetical protein M902_0978 [Bacteriovorax sp. BAL6_X]|nr:hypothetical protein M902_0978 [Bacteriovorax sp. BAL6_X]
MSFTHEAHEIKLSGNNLESIKIQKSQLDHPDNCDDHDRGTEHCYIHCSGLHYLVNIDHAVKLKSPLIELNKNQPLRLNFFKSPDLDPAKKPPSLS